MRLCSCVLLALSTFASSCGPKSDTVARTGTPAPMPPSARYSVGKPVGANGSPSSAWRFSAALPASPGCERPDRSPFTSAAKTGTPAADSASASSCSVRVLPVPVAPAIRPWRFIIASGMRTTASCCSAPSCTPRPSSIAAPSVA